MLGALLLPKRLFPSLPFNIWDLLSWVFNYFSSLFIKCILFFYLQFYANCTQVMEFSLPILQWEIWDSKYQATLGSVGWSFAVSFVCFYKMFCVSWCAQNRKVKKQRKIIRQKTNLPMFVPAPNSSIFIGECSPYYGKVYFMYFGIPQTIIVIQRKTQLFLRSFNSLLQTFWHMHILQIYSYYTYQSL